MVINWSLVIDDCVFAGKRIRVSVMYKSSYRNVMFVMSISLFAAHTYILLLW
jgi:hypothetical protein